MKRMVFFAVLALSACNQPKTDQTVDAPVVEPGGGENGGVVIKAGDTGKNSVVITFDNGQIVHATEIGRVGGASVAPDIGQPPLDLASIMNAQASGAPIFGYEVESEAGTSPLCGMKEVVSIAIMKPRSGKAKLAAITGAHFGEEGSLICNIHEVDLTDATPRFAN